MRALSGNGWGDPARGFRLLAAYLWCWDSGRTSNVYCMKAGFTLVEVVIVLVIVGILTALGTPRLGKALDQLAVARSVHETVGFYRSARFAAIVRGKRVRIEFGRDSLVAVIEGRPDTVFMRRAGPAVFGVSLTVSRPTIRISVTGLGYGAANTKLVFRRGSAADSLAISRIGRIRRSR